MNGDIMNNVRCKISRNFRNKNNYRDSCRGMHEFKKGYQLRTNLEKDKNGDLLAYFHIISTRWKNYFCQLLNEHMSNNVR
jgi:hypothetical protein